MSQQQQPSATAGFKSGLSRPTPVKTLHKKSDAIMQEDMPSDEDPIAQTQWARITKLGGLAGTTTEAEAKKKGIPVFKVPKLQLPKGKAQEDFTPDGAAEESKGQGAGSRLVPPSRIQRPSSNAMANRRKPSANRAKPSSGAGHVYAEENLEGVDDPIAQGIQDRMKLGGLGMNVTELEAKKKGMKVTKTPKVIQPAKAQATMLDLTPKDSANANSVTGSPNKRASPDKKGAIGARSAGLQLRPKTASIAGNEAKGSQLDGDISEDPIALSLTDRIAAGGFAMNFTDLEAKKKGYHVFKCSKLLTKGVANIDFIPNSSPAASNSPKKTGIAQKSAGLQIQPKGLKPPTKDLGSKSGSAQKATRGAEIDKDADPASDPIAASMNERIKAGNFESIVKEADAKRKKIPFPEPLKLKIADAKLLTIANEEESKTNGSSKIQKPTQRVHGIEKQSSSISMSSQKSKQTNPYEFDDTDPIDATCYHRLMAGSVSSTLNEADARRKKVAFPKPLKLQIKSNKTNPGAKPELLITFCTQDTQVQEEEQISAPTEKKEQATFETDPIEHTAMHRNKMGDPIPVKEAEAKGLDYQKSPSLSMQNSSSVDLHPTEASVPEDQTKSDQLQEALMIAEAKMEAETKDEEARVEQESQDKEAALREAKELEAAEAKAEEERQMLEAQEAAKMEAQEEEDRKRREAEELEAVAAEAERQKMELEAKEAAEREAAEKAEKELKEQQEREAEEARLEEERAELEEKEAQKRAEQDAGERLSKDVQAAKEAEDQALREAQEAEARLEKEREEIEKKEAEERAAKEAEDKATKEAEERAAKEAEEQASREAEEARLEKEREELEKKEAEERAAKEAEEKAAKDAADKVAKEAAEREAKEAEELAALEAAQNGAEDDAAEESRKTAIQEAELQALDGNNDLQDLEEDSFGQKPQEDDIIQHDENDAPLEADSAHLTVDNDLSKDYIQQQIEEAKKSQATDLTEQKSEDKPAADTKKTSASVKIDPVVIKTIWPYLRADEPYPNQAKIDAEGAELAEQLLNDLEIEITKNTARIANIRNDHPSAETDSLGPDFELSSMATSGLQILEEIPLDFDDWIESQAEEEWVIRTLKIWFFLIKDFAAVHRWANWPDIFDDKAFMKKASGVIEEIADEFNEYLQENALKLNLDDPAHLAKAECMLQHLGGASQIDPHHADGDSSVATFIMFVLKDALQFAGLLPDKKRVPAREIRICLYKEDFFKQQQDALKSALGQ